MRGITNAKPKDGVLTINNLAPDGNGNFTVEAGTGVTITAGTNKITIDASGGGSWTKRAANDDWSDMLSYDGTDFTPLKNIVLIHIDTASNNATGVTYLPKGVKISNPICINYNTVTGSGSNLRIYTRAMINASNYNTSQYLAGYYYNIAFNVDFDNKTFSFTRTNSTSNINKTKFQIYISD